MSYHENANGRTVTAIDALLEKADTALQAGHIDTDTATTAIHHTLGTGANQAAAGNDTRLSDARTPVITGLTDIGAALADGDELPVYDLSVTAVKKSALSRVWTYILAKIGAAALPAGGIVSETVSSTLYPVASQYDIGTEPNEVPLNQFLGDLAYQDRDQLVIRQVVPVTGSVSPSNSDSQTTYTNEGDSDGATILLPTAAPGLQYRAYVQTAQTLTITAGADDTIRIGSSVTAAAGSISSAVVGSFIDLQAINYVEWVAASAVGSWSI